MVKIIGRVRKENNRLKIESILIFYLTSHIKTFDEFY